MAPDRRLTQLRALVDRIERLPASPRKEWMLHEARSRMVDVETGDEPRAMRTLQEASAEAPQDPAGRWVGNGRAVKRPSSKKPTAAAASRSRSRPERATQKAPISVPEPAPSRIVGWQPSAAEVFTDDVLSLGDVPIQTDAESGAGPPGIAPWRRGLRG